MGSEARAAKTKMLGERMFRFIMYITYTGWLYYILNGTKFLDSSLGGQMDRPPYFKDYPC